MVTGKSRSLPVNIPNAGQVPDLAEGLVVECMGLVDAGGVRPRTWPAPGRRPSTCVGWRRPRSSQCGPPSPATASSVLEAMLADPVAGSLPWEAVVEMTGDLLAATAPWLPQFER